MPADALKCKECETDLSARGALRLRALLRPARGRATRAPDADPDALKRRIQAGPAHASGATPTSCRSRAPPRSRAADGLDAAGAGRPARRAPRPRRAVGQERDRQPDALVQGPRRLRRARPCARARLRHARLRLDRQPRQRRRRPRRRRRAARLRASSRPTSRSRRSSPPAPTARTSSRVRGNYDDVNRLCTEVSGERAGWAFVNVNMRPYYAEGSKTLAFETAEQLGWELPGPHRRRRSPPARCSRRSRAASRSSSTPGCVDGDAADDERRPGRAAARRSRTAFAAGTTSAARSSRTRSPSRWRSATRPTARTRSSSRAAPAAAIDAVTDDEIRAGIRLLAETTGIFTETAGGVTIATLAKLAERGDIGADERVVRVITGDGPEDDRRRARHVRGRPRSRRRSTRSRRAFAPAARLMAVTVKLPTQLRDAAGGAADGDGRRRTVGEALDGLYAAARRAARADRRRRRRPAPLRQRLPQGRGHPLPRRPRDRRSPTATRSRSCRRWRAAS